MTRLDCSAVVRKPHHANHAQGETKANTSRVSISQNSIISDKTAAKKLFTCLVFSEVKKTLRYLHQFPLPPTDPHNISLRMTHSIRLSATQTFDLSHIGWDSR